MNDPRVEDAPLEGTLERYDARRDYRVQDSVLRHSSVPALDEAASDLSHQPSLAHHGYKSIVVRFTARRN